MALLTVAALVGTAWLLKRRDPSLLSAPHAATARTAPALPPAPPIPVDRRPA
jgi:hypothetical protein